MIDLPPPPYTSDAASFKSDENESVLDSQALASTQRTLELVKSFDQWRTTTAEDVRQSLTNTPSVISNVTAGDLITVTTKAPSSAASAVSKLTRADLIGLGAGTIGAGAVAGGAKFFTDFKTYRTEQSKLRLAEKMGKADMDLKEREILLKDAEIAIKQEEKKHIAEKSQIELQLLKAQVAKEEGRRCMTTASTQTDPHGPENANNDPLGSRHKVRSVKTPTIVKTPKSPQKTSKDLTTSPLIADLVEKPATPQKPQGSRTSTNALILLVGLLIATKPYHALLVLGLAVIGATIPARSTLAMPAPSVRSF